MENDREFRSRYTLTGTLGIWFRRHCNFLVSILTSFFVSFFILGWWERGRKRDKREAKGEDEGEGEGNQVIPSIGEDVDNGNNSHKLLVRVYINITLENVWVIW